MADVAWIYEMVGAWNACDGTKAASYLTADGHWEDVTSRLAWSPDEFAEAFSVKLPALASDAQFEVESAVCDGVGFAMQWRWYGTHNATGRSFSIRAASVGRLRDGRVEAAFDYWNPAHLAEQIADPVERPS